MIEFALLACPLLIIAMAGRVPLPQLVLVAVIGGYLLLPTQGGWNPPILPPFNKQTIPSLTVLLVALVMCASTARASMALADPDGLNQRGWIPRSPVMLIPIGLLLVGAFATVLTNGDTLTYGPRRIPGLRLYDAFSIIMISMVLLVPLFLGWKFFAHPDRLRLLLHGLIIAALAYSVLALYEIRMSPQLNRMIYGFFPHDWGQHVRGGGYRPLVFLEHGLALAIFMSMAVIAAFGVYRLSGRTQKGLYFGAGGWLLLTLLLSNSLAALLIVVMLTPIVLLSSTRMQVTAAAVIAAMTLSYPMLRSADVIPTEQLVEVMREIAPARAPSLNFRFINEDILLEHARERPLAGWGTFGRNRVYDETGADQTVIDGMWIVEFTIGGWLGYLGTFGLLTLPIIVAAARMRKDTVDPEVGILSLLLAAQLIYLIPNGFMSPVSWLIAGALLGRLELSRAAVPRTEDDAGAPVRAPTARGRTKPAATTGEAPRPEPDRNRGGQVYTRQTSHHRRVETQGG